MMQTTNDRDVIVNGHTFFWHFAFPPLLFTIKRLSFIFLCHPTEVSAFHCYTSDLLYPLFIHCLP